MGSSSRVFGMKSGIGEEEREAGGCASESATIDKIGR